jgi:prepilin-type N-terminal cleavage/methylation domain-containing protein
MNKRKNKNNSAGFTLIEVLVAISIFVILLTIFGNFFHKALDIQRTSLTSYEVLNTASYNLEYMSRAIRMAKKDRNGVCISKNNNYEFVPYPGADGIRFMNDDGNCQEFYLINGRLFEVRDGDTLPLTPVHLEINSFTVGKDGSCWDQSELIQPKVSLILEIEGIKFKTLISQRNLNVRY